MSQIHIVEVGPRDGLQNVQELLSLEQKKNLLAYLLAQGLQHVEAGSFVRADRVPQMANSDQIAQAFQSEASRLWYLTPNQKGLESALENHVRQVAFFTASSPSFNRKNIGMDVEESVDKILASIQWLVDQGYDLVKNWDEQITHDRQIKIRLYISTVIGCPHEGLLDPSKTISLLSRFVDRPIAQFSLGDTIGVGTPSRWKKLLQQVSQLDEKLLTSHRIAMHCHNTYGTALASVAQGLELNVKTFDSSIGGLGGCPFAPGATGNLATEDLLYFLDAEGFDTGIDLKKLLDVFQTNRTGSLINRSSVFSALGKKS